MLIGCPPRSICRQEFKYVKMMANNLFNELGRDRGELHFLQADNCRPGSKDSIPDNLMPDRRV
jgi:hypothetical protein